MKLIKFEVCIAFADSKNDIGHEIAEELIEVFRTGYEAEVAYASKHKVVVVPGPHFNYLDDPEAWSAQAQKALDQL